MSEERKSDFEMLFAKCAENEEYASQLGTALQPVNRERVRQLLASIGIAGDEEQFERRLNALQGALGPMSELSTAFGRPPGLAP